MGFRCLDSTFLSRTFVRKRNSAIPSTIENYNEKKFAYKIVHKKNKFTTYFIEGASFPIQISLGKRNLVFPKKTIQVLHFPQRILTLIKNKVILQDELFHFFLEQWEILKSKDIFLNNIEFEKIISIGSSHIIIRLKNKFKGYVLRLPIIDETNPLPGLIEWQRVLAIKNLLRDFDVKFPDPPPIQSTFLDHLESLTGGSIEAEITSLPINQGILDSGFWKNPKNFTDYLLESIIAYETNPLLFR